MRKVFAATVVAFLASLGIALTSAPASAVPTTDCRTVTVNLTDRDDTGATDGSVWAKDALARTLKVCKGDEAEVEGKSTYYANVIDKGTFVTVAGKSPVAGTPILAGIEGTVNGGFAVTKFTAPTWDKDFKLTAPPSSTSSPNWVSVAFPDSTGATISSYKWTYKSACQRYIDDNGKYTGDITLKCVTTEDPTVSAATCDAPGEPVLPDTEGVLYVAGDVVDGKVVVTATSKTGYKLVGDKYWTLTIPAQLTGDQCKEPTTPPATTPPTTPPATNDPGTGGGGTVSPTPSQSEIVAAPPMNNSGSELPVTGSSASTMLYLLGGGLMLIAIGGGAVLYARRNRDEVEFTS